MAQSGNQLSAMLQQLRHNAGFTAHLIGDLITVRLHHGVFLDKRVKHQIHQVNEGLHGLRAPAHRSLLRLRD
jgi:hypothetical protein